MPFDDRRRNGDERICTAPPIKSEGGEAIWEYTVGVPKKNTRTTPDRVTVSFRDVVFGTICSLDARRNGYRTVKKYVNLK